MKGFGDENKLKKKKKEVIKGIDALGSEIMMKAYRYNQNGDIRNAAKYYQIFLDKGYSDPNVLINYGLICNKLELTKQALTLYKKAVRLYPNNPIANSNLGNILNELGKTDQAKEYLLKTIKLEPFIADHYFNLSNIFGQIGNLNDEEKYLRKAIELNPNFSLAYTYLGINLYLNGKKDSSLQSLEKAHSLDPDYGSNILMKVIESKNRREKKKNKNENKLLSSNPLLLTREVNQNLLDSLYKIKTINLNKFEDPTFGNAKGSDYNFFNDADDIHIENLKNDLVKMLYDSIGNEILVVDSFFTILEGSGRVEKHNHLNDIDRIKVLNLAKEKYSLVYYLSVGDQECKYPGILKLYNPYKDILPYKGMVIIFPADRYHSVLYNGNKDRVIVGINCYSI